MRDSEKEWIRAYDVDHRNMYTKSMASLAEIDSVRISHLIVKVPLIYGKKNDRYVSPTFRSN